MARTATLVATLLLAGVLRAEQEAAAVPETYTAKVMLEESGPLVRVEITIEAWTDNEIRSDLAEALQASGTRGLVEEMGKLEVGRLQVQGGASYELRVASTWQGEQGRHVRVATERPLLLQEPGTSAPGDYPFGIAEFVLPRRGPGEGSLLPAARLRFDDEGRLVVQAPPGDSDLRKMTSVEQQKGKRKKR